MSETVNQVSIFVPVLVVAALTFVAFLRMGAGRAAAMKTGLDPKFYRAHQGGQEPEATAAAVRHYNNLFELPTLFYAACITAFVLGAVGMWTLIFAWGYVAFRLIQSAVHMTYNNPAHRGGAFMVGVLFVVALWINVGMTICAAL